MVRRNGPTIVDVARLAGVSPSTASRVVTEKKVVRPELVLRVQEAVQELGYRPNLAARGLRQSKTMTLGLVFHSLVLPTQLDLVKGIESVCHPHGYSLMVTDARSDEGRYKEAVRRLREHRVDGLFLVAPGLIDGIFEDGDRAEMPVFAVQSSDPGNGSIPLIAMSERRSMNAAVASLVELGHERVGFLSIPTDQTRQALIAEALAQHHLPVGSLVSSAVPRGAPLEEVESALRNLLDSKPRITALFVHLEYLTQALKTLRRLRLVVPSDLSLVSIGDASWLELVDPPVAAVAVDWHSLGVSAATAMFNWLGGARPRRGMFAGRGTFEARASLAQALTDKQ